MKSQRSKAAAAKVDREEILPEYDFSRAMYNKFAARFAVGSNVVVLEPAVGAMFSSATEVNEALRALAEIIQTNRAAHRPRRFLEFPYPAPDDWREFDSRSCVSNASITNVGELRTLDGSPALSGPLYASRRHL